MVNFTSIINGRAACLEALKAETKINPKDILKGKTAQA